jgi:hypothetical protein
MGIPSVAQATGSHLSLPAPKPRPKIQLLKYGQSCDAVCKALGAWCDQGALDSLRSQYAVETAFRAAGKRCALLHTDAASVSGKAAARDGFLVLNAGFHQCEAGGCERLQGGGWAVGDGKQVTECETGELGGAQGKGLQR